jgi:hypothetical protein
VPADSVGSVTSFLGFQYSKVSGTRPTAITIMRGIFLDEESWFSLWSPEDSSDEEDDEDEDEE